MQSPRKHLGQSIGLGVLLALASVGMLWTVASF